MFLWEYKVEEKVRFLAELRSEKNANNLELMHLILIGGIS